MRWHKFVQQTATKQGDVDAWRRTRWLLITVFILSLSVVSASGQTPERPSEEPTASHLPDVFGRLWKIYPNKSDRTAAIEAWNNLKVSDEELFKMRTAYPLWAFSSEWVKEKGRHVPPLATWLSERMWEKAPPPQAPPTIAELSSFFDPTLVSGSEVGLRDHRHDGWGSGVSVRSGDGRQSLGYES